MNQIYEIVVYVVERVKERQPKTFPYIQKRKNITLKSAKLKQLYNSSTPIF